MAYSPKNLRDLIDAVKRIEKKYKEAKEKNKIQVLNEDRLRIITLSDAIVSFLTHINVVYKKNPSPILRELITATFITCREAIRKEYKLFDPEYKEGLIINTGSLLYNLYSDELGITDKNKINDKEIFVYVEKFCNFIFNTDKSIFSYDTQQLEQLFKAKQLDLGMIQTLTIKLWQRVLKRVSLEIDNFIAAIPTEEAINDKMEKLYVHYMDAKKNQKFSFFHIYHENKERQFYAQLGEAICNVLPSNKDAVPPDELSRSQRTKMGVLTLFMEDIYHEKKYWVPLLNSPKNSMLFSICSDTANVANPDVFSPHFKLDWLSTLSTFLGNSNNISLLEEYGRKNFDKSNLLKCIDHNMKMINKKLEDMTDQLGYQTRSNHFPIANTLGNLFALIAAAPGYGLGYNIGGYLSNHDRLVGSKKTIGAGISSATAYFGFSGSTMGFFVADFLMGSTLTRAFAKVLELIGKIIGFATGYTIGFSFDLTYLGLTNLCKCFLHLHHHYKDKVEFIKNEDVAFIQSILNIPPELDFAEVKKTKVNKLAQENLFRIEKSVVEIQEENMQQQAPVLK